MWTALWSVAWAATCAQHPSNRDLEATLQPADTAVASLDATSLTVALDEARAGVVCLSAVADRATMAHFWGLVGIEAFVGGRTEEAVASFASARALGWTLPDNLAGTLRATWDASADVEPGRRDLPGNVGTEWWAVDGAAARTAPDRRPFLLQRVGEQDAVLESWLVGRSGDLPAPAPAPPAPVPVTESDVAGHPSRTLLIGGLGALVAGSGAAAGAALAERSYDRSTQPDAELGGTRTVNAVLGYGAVGLLVAGGGLGATAVIVGRW